MPLFGGKKKEDEVQLSRFDVLVQEMRKQRVDDFMILSQMIAAMNDLVDSILKKEDYHTLVATESHIEKILLAKIKEAVNELEKKK